MKRFIIIALLLIVCCAAYYYFFREKKSESEMPKFKNPIGINPKPVDDGISCETPKFKR
jgi:hypothetical protein